MLTTAFIAGVFTLLGAGITYLGTLRVQLRLQVEARASARQDRVRNAYMAVLRAAMTFHQIAIYDSSTLGQTESFDSRSERYAHAVATVRDDLETASLVLNLEVGDSAVLELFGVLRLAFTTYLTGIERNAAQPNTVGQAALKAQQETIKTALTALTNAMRADLGTTVATPPPKSRPWWRLWR